ncbi:molybdopterin-dependent oxidoreductase [Nocardia sp. SYP-A9097]|uniref:molybdopterin-dependent oxidoreductase n=1 Tax=Nocardia sp. SYP-A9097 TaxID=2663237 RepID=UPI001321AE01|nr:molybdopterin-dependent oxidoreductase [Nocardia sp. SYP-A9097]MRH91136.1 molybdopterin-dependent oxidoreductase [Nocardia sp. SYP-A9097]
MAGRELRIAGGIAAAAVTLGVAELVAVLISPDSTPLQAIGSSIVDHTPDGVREWVIQTFGTNDKLVLFISMGAVALIAAGIAGLVERAHRPIGSILFAALGLSAAVAAVTRSHASWTWALPSLLGACAGIMVLRTLIRRITDLDAAGESATDTEKPAAEVNSDTALERRLVMRGIGIALGAGAAAGIVGRVLGARRRDVSGERAEVQLPPPAEPKVAVDPAADLRIPGLASYLTPNRDFYRIDTALTVPQVSKDDWSLRIHGMVDREIRITYADLGSRQAIEKLVTLTCVSNPVGGDLIGNASWLGYRLDELLAEAGPHADADMVLSRSIDGFTAGSPLAVLTDGRDAMLAVGMNGEPLPTAHGYPARLVVPGLYGYVSATKWVTELEITRFDRAQAYWTRRGWSARGPIKTGTRIDTPAGGSKPAAGKVTVAGVAWAQHRGIRAVEVRIDNGEWQPARLAAEPSVDTWRQWAFDWDATPGPHTIWARSTDGDGVVQTSDRVGEIPDGATGYASNFVRVG